MSKVTLVAFILFLGLSSNQYAQSLLRGDYNKVVRYLEQVAQGNDNTSTFTLTHSLLKNTPIMGVEIIGPKVPGQENITHLIVGTHHGDEWGAAEVTLRTTDYFARNPIKGINLIIIPVLMPDSFKRRRRQYAGVNPNRDYPGPCGSHDGNGKPPFKLNGTQALSDLIRDKHVIAAITVHNPWETVHYPWNVKKESKTRDHEVFKFLLEESYKNTPYSIGTVADMFYTMKGAFSDYVFWEFGVWGILVEIGGGKRPSLNKIQKKTETHLKAFKKFLTLAPRVRSQNNIFLFDCGDSQREEFLDFHE